MLINDGEFSFQRGGIPLLKKRKRNKFATKLFKINTQYLNVKSSYRFNRFVIAQSYGRTWQAV